MRYTIAEVKAAAKKAKCSLATMYRRIEGGESLEDCTYIKDDRESGSPEARAWRDAIQRCHNPRHKDYVNYGARGIAVCDEWRRSLQAFIKHAGRRPHPTLTLDRINNELGYQPGNVRWTTRLEQARNRRKHKSAAAIITYQI